MDVSLEKLVCAGKDPKVNHVGTEVILIENVGFYIESWFANQNDSNLEILIKKNTNF